MWMHLCWQELLQGGEQGFKDTFSDSFLTKNQFT